MVNFEEVYNRQVDTVFKICVLYIKKIDDAEEATQDTFIRYMKYNPEIETIKHEKNWFIKTATNICKNILKSSWFKMKLNDSMKFRILENVYNELNTNEENQKNKLNNLQNLSRSNDSLNKPVSRSRGSIKDNEFDINILKDNTVKVEIKNDENDKVFKEITDKKSINNLLKLLQESKEKNLNSQNYNDFKNTGKIITLSFITKDNLISSIKINLDLNITCINEKYYNVSPEMIKIIYK